MAHIHAELMKQYAEDAANYDEPWLLWEQCINALWLDLDTHPTWGSHIKLRRKLTKPNPLKEKPKNGDKYYVLCLGESPGEYVWTDHEIDNRMLDQMRVFKTRADASAAEKWIIEKLKESSNDNN